MELQRQAEEGGEIFTLPDHLKEKVGIWHTSFVYILYASARCGCPNCPHQGLAAASYGPDGGMHSTRFALLFPGSTHVQVEEQYRRDMIAVHGEGAAAMEDEYKSFLRDLGGDVPLVPRWVKGWCVQ